MRRAEIQAVLQDAITLAQSGQRTEARRLLEQVVEADPKQELAWMWLATVSTNRDERITFLERALVLNPANNTAQEAYAQLTGRAFTPAVVPPDVPALPASGMSPDVRLVLRGGLILITMLVFLALAAFVIAGQLTEDDNPRPLPTMRTTSDPFIQPSSPFDTASTRPAATWTPLPTATFGPSPTSIWDAPPPTWTPGIADTPAPTLTSVPSATPYPTAEVFIGPYALSATAAFVQTSDAGPATVEYVQTQAATTPTHTLTTDLLTATVKFEQTSQAATAAATLTPEAE